MHPRVLEEHRKAGFELILRSEHRVEAWFEAITAGQPRRNHVDAIYRIRKGRDENGKPREYMYYHRTIISQDEYGDKKTFSQYIGKIEVPVFSFQYDQISKQRKATGIDSYVEEYEIPFSIEKLNELEEKEEIDDRTACAVHARGRIYSIENYYDWKERSYDDLSYYCGKNEWPPKQESVDKSQQDEGIKPRKEETKKQ